jgi:hypothetical protein
MIDRNLRRLAFQSMVPLLLPLGWGCAWVRGPSGPGMNEDELATLARPDTVQMDVSPDTTFSEPVVTNSPRTLPRETPTTNTRPAETTRTETIETPRVDISVQMSESERSALEQEARDRILRTQQILGGIDASAFTSAKQDALITIEGLIASAGTALDQGDVQAADSLARKALLLATDLAPK